MGFQLQSDIAAKTAIPQGGQKFIDRQRAAAIERHVRIFSNETVGEMHAADEIAKSLKLGDRIAAIAPEKKDMLIKVVAPPEETWPLPWYLRGYGRVGYWTEPRAALKAPGTGEPAVVISSAAFADELAAALGDGYEQTFYGLRPEVLLSLFVRRGP